MSNSQKFVPGDPVLINGSLAAVIETYDADLDVVRYTSTAGGGTDTTTGHVSQTRIEHLIQPAVGADEKPSVELGKHEDSEDDSE